MDGPPNAKREVMLAALARRLSGVGGTKAPVKPEPIDRQQHIPSPSPPPPTARFPGMGVIDTTKPDPEPSVKAHPATQHHSIVITKAQNSSLFKLPESVRTTIYRLAMVPHTPPQIKRRPFAAEHNLLFTCKLIRKEAQLMFWTENSFRGRDAVYICTSRTRAPQVLYQRKLSVLLEWLGRIGKEKAGLIKKLQFDYDEDCQFNGHPEYQSNWPATAEDVMKNKQCDLAGAAKFAAIKILRGLLFHGVPLNSIQPVCILKGVLRDGQGDQFGALWKKAMEEVIAVLKASQQEIGAVELAGGR